MSHEKILVGLWTLALGPLASFATAFVIGSGGREGSLLLAVAGIYGLLYGMPLLAIATILWTANFWLDAQASGKPKEGETLQSWVWPVVIGSVLSLFSTGAGAVAILIRFTGGISGPYYKPYFLLLALVDSLGLPLLIYSGIKSRRGRRATR